MPDIAPQRIQRKRTKGWRKPGGSVYVGRGSIYGNPFRVGTDVDRGEVPTRAEAARLHAAWMEKPWEWLLPPPPDLKALRGKDLVCWCPPSERCHADTLLLLANSEPTHA